MDEKLCNERYELVLSELHEELSSLLSRTRGLKTVCQPPAELDRLVHYTAEIRHLLAELECMQFWSQNETLGRSLSDIKLQFLDLEGRLKEQRNDLLNRV